jgi:penicillin V acylase-like amidase (Ntn superfamily)
MQYTTLETFGYTVFSAYSVAPYDSWLGGRSGLGDRVVKPRQPALASAIILVLMLISCRQPPALPTYFPKDAPPSASAASHECTSFCLENDGYCIFGTNHDNSIHEGILYVNKRDVSKTGWDPSTTGEVARWTSEYGSLTFNLVGYQLPWGGMNEAGLMISTMALEASLAPAPDGRPPLETALWTQYQLDNSSTVDEVIASESLVRMTSQVPACCHFLVCDRKGDCATVELLGGEMVYHTGETLPVDALTNSTYEESVTSWQTANLSGDSLVRFGIAADGVTNFQPTDSEAAVEYAFDTLARAGSSDWTVWTIVFDPENLRVHFRTKWNSQIRSIDFSRLDFACGTEVQMLNVRVDLSRDISDDLEIYSHDVSLDHFANVVEKLGLGIPREQTEALLQQMERFPCASGEEHIVQETPQVSPWIWLITAVVLVIVPVAVWYGARKRVERD